ncbi:MAG: IspD/TarI family cytidylyltransferase, partial [Acidimicrobiia bacterium]
MAAGLGSRYGGPKQFDDLGGRPVIDWAVEAARSVCDGVVVVLPESGDRLGWFIGVEEGLQSVSGGPTRSSSVRAGLAAVPEAATVVVV